MNNSNIWSQLVAFDHHLFHLINREWVNRHLDRIMIFLTNFDETRYILIGVALMLLITQRRYGFKIILACLIAVGISDSLAARVIKPHFHRSRPQFVERDMRLIVPSQNTPGFVSNHAANSFAVATVLGSAMPSAFWPSMMIATAIAYSRVYVGVHYPLDVAGGALIGYVIGTLIWLLFQKLFNRLKIPTISGPFWKRSAYYTGRKSRKK